MLEPLITECLKAGQAVRFRAPGRSMLPTIRENETVIVAPVDPERLAIGDIVLSGCREKITAHRLIRIESAATDPQGPVGSKAEPVFILRGDACSTCDAPVPAHQIFGKVVAIERRGRLLHPYGLRTESRRRLHAFASLLKSHLLSAFRRLF